jgi:hypothetical protein
MHLVCQLPIRHSSHHLAPKGAPYPPHAYMPCALAHAHPCPTLLAHAVRCSWFGVTCCATSLLDLDPCYDEPHSVAMLMLDSFGLAGTLPPQMAGLPQLRALGLGNNPNLTGGVPPQLAALTNLLWMSVEVRPRASAACPPPCTPHTRVNLCMSAA